MTRGININIHYEKITQPRSQRLFSRHSALLNCRDKRRWDRGRKQPKKFPYLINDETSNDLAYSFKYPKQKKQPIRFKLTYTNESTPSQTEIKGINLQYPEKIKKRICSNILNMYI